MSLDRLLTEEKLRCDLGIRLAVDDEPCHLEFAFGQRLDTDPIDLARARSAVDAMSELPELAFRVVAVTQRAAGIQFGGGALQLRRGTVTLAGLGQGAARERARQRCFDRRPPPRRLQRSTRVPARPPGWGRRQTGRRPPTLDRPRRRPSVAVRPRPMPER